MEGKTLEEMNTVTLEDMDTFERQIQYDTSHVEYIIGKYVNYMTSFALLIHNKCSNILYLGKSPYIEELVDFIDGNGFQVTLDEKRNMYIIQAL